MNRRLFTGLAIILFVVFFSYTLQQNFAVDIADSEADESWIPYTQRISVFGGYAGIRLADEDFLRRFEYVHEIGSYVPGREDVVVWALSEPLAGFEFAWVINGNDSTWDDFFYVQGRILFSIDVLQQGHAVLLRNHVGQSWHPAFGISFFDSTGLRRYVGFGRSLGNGDTAPFWFVEYALNEGRPPLSLPPWVY